MDKKHAWSATCQCKVGETCDDNEANFYKSLQAESPANAHFQKYQFQNAEAKQLFFPQLEKEKAYITSKYTHVLRRKKMYKTAFHN